MSSTGPPMGHGGVTYSTSPQESISPPIITPYSSEPANKSNQQDRFIRLTVTTSSCHFHNLLDLSGLIWSGLKDGKNLQNSFKTFSIREDTIDRLTKKLYCLLFQQKPQQPNYL